MIARHRNARRLLTTIVTGTGLAALSLFAVTPASATPSCASGKVCLFSGSSYTGTQHDVTPTGSYTSLPFAPGSGINNSTSRVGLFDVDYAVIVTWDAPGQSGQCGSCRSAVSTPAAYLKTVS
ncbi:peptidase inhibitor family I36 protein [Actinomadura hibisca]|uniref:peptidase inhibitor family I36 protein n=1 Tax=Actinomadura hibisca TaxID=68565 RepID=UPI00082F25E1|nr:peptidase inhibitor family I36 protein [Actinomadura hibisca]